MAHRGIVWMTGIFAVLAVCWQVEARAATLTVTSSGDGLNGPGCTLRMAVAAANNGSTNACGHGSGNGDTIQLGGTSATTITLTPSLGSIVVSSSMTIQGNYQGAHPDFTTVSINTTGGSLMQVLGQQAKNVTLTLKWLRLTGAHGSLGYGGCLGINPAASGNHNTTNLTTVQIDHCGAWSGGAVYSAGGLNITSSSLHDNHASFGGAVTMDGGNGDGGYALVATSTTFSNNAADLDGASGQGGAVIVVGATSTNGPDLASIIASGCSFTGNHAPYGGGVYAWQSHNTFVETTFDSNVATVDGGGLYVYGGGGNIIHNTTFGKNTASGNGGGIWWDGTAYWEVSQNTVAENSAGSNGGGFYKSGTGGTIEDGNNIFAYNTAPSGGDLWGDFTFFGGPDIVMNYSGTPPSDYNGFDPQLGTFQSVNGMPKVFPLLPGSIAIDTASWGPTYDERGSCRPLGSNYDIGAFEYDTASTYQLLSVNSGMALDDPNSSHTAGQQMEQWTANTGSNQAWTMSVSQILRLGSVVRLVNQASGLTLGVRGNSTSNGAAVEQNSWTGATGQQWTLTRNARVDYLNFVNLNSSQQLDVIGASKTAGALIDQWPTSGGTNQQWTAQVRASTRCSGFPY